MENLFYFRKKLDKQEKILYNIHKLSMTSKKMIVILHKIYWLDTGITLV